MMMMQIQYFFLLCWCTLSQSFAEESSYNYIDQSHRITTTHHHKAFENKSELVAAIDAYIDLDNDVLDTKTLYGPHIGRWNVGDLDDFSYVFSAQRNPKLHEFNEDLTDWDVSKATTMKKMFMACSSFNGDISTWDTSNVENMYGMLSGADSFNRDISKWNVGKVKDMQYMLNSGEGNLAQTSFNVDISSWDVSKVTNMRGMFDGSTSFNQDLTGWDVSRVTNFNMMFQDTHAFDGDISTWDLSRAGTTRLMFHNAKAFGKKRQSKKQHGHGSLKDWDTSHIHDMAGMFAYAAYFNDDISNWDVSNVDTMNEMFIGASMFNRNIGKWDVSNVRDMMNMFEGAIEFDQNLCRWGYKLRNHEEALTLEKSVKFEDIFENTKCASTEAPTYSNRDDFNFCTVGCAGEEDLSQFHDDDDDNVDDDDDDESSEDTPIAGSSGNKDDDDDDDDDEYDDDRYVDDDDDSVVGGSKVMKRAKHSASSSTGVVLLVALILIGVMVFALKTIGHYQKRGFFRSSIDHANDTVDYAYAENIQQQYDERQSDKTYTNAFFDGTRQYEEKYSDEIEMERIEKEII